MGVEQLRNRWPRGRQGPGLGWAPESVHQGQGGSQRSGLQMASQDQSQGQQPQEATMWVELATGSPGCRRSLVGILAKCTGSPASRPSRVGVLSMAGDCCRYGLRVEGLQLLAGHPGREPRLRSEGAQAQAEAGKRGLAGEHPRPPAHRLQPRRDNSGFKMPQTCTTSRVQRGQLSTGDAAGCLLIPVGEGGTAPGLGTTAGGPPAGFL